VRKKVAEKLYLYFMTIEDPSIYNISYEDIETISLLLSETNWTLKIDEIRESRNTIAQLLKINMDNVTKMKPKSDN
jgi:hypothetical protein